MMSNSTLTFKSQKVPTLSHLKSLPTHPSEDRYPAGSPVNGESPTKNSFYYTPQGYGFAFNQSASTLQHSATSWKFAKSPRFPKIRNLTEFNNFEELPSLLDQKSTSFGFGSKSQVLEIQTKRSAEFPSPNSYRIKSEFGTNKTKGKSFGLSFSAYAKTYVPNCTWVPPEIAKDYPGPGQYLTPNLPEPKKPRITIKRRLKMFNEGLGMDVPSSSHYRPITTLQESARYRKITFGFGTKHDFTKVTNQNPGPGAYKVMSKFDKIVAQKKKVKRITSN